LSGIPRKKSSPFLVITCKKLKFLAGDHQKR